MHIKKQHFQIIPKENVSNQRKYLIIAKEKRPNSLEIHIFIFKNEKKMEQEKIHFGRLEGGQLYTTHVLQFKSDEKIYMGNESCIRSIFMCTQFVVGILLGIHIKWISLFLRNFHDWTYLYMGKMATNQQQQCSKHHQ